MVDLVKGDTRLIISVCRKHGLLRNQAAYVLATAHWETARTMKPVREYGGEKYLQSKPYYPFVGMGYVQLTWEANYRKASQILGVDFVGNPKLLLEPAHASEILVRGMMGGWFTGKKLSDYIILQRSDFVNARRIVNGMDKAQEIAVLAHEYDSLLKVDGYGEESTTREPSIPKLPTSKTDLPATTQKNTGKGGLIGLIVAAIAAAAGIFFGITGD
ncbi:hypothetical protein GCM10011385_00260 [Nitratireductor aestuarii]|uniref:Glycoside hydrolase family 19 catalytic domain-containing protein n=1 Tax=Nitratireductor aestuarii TaxID=1735103 RepID=A0A916VXH6_9HYPH|nr:carboxypeptidase [Nitratireductor aestuarii]GGA50968.1 hypothetical protein GCM10011385_00260 [Nitratireductor aestuarii]